MRVLILPVYFLIGYFCARWQVNLLAGVAATLALNLVWQTWMEVREAEQESDS